MKKVGMIGGISWITTVDYLNYMNKIIGEKRGGLNNAPCIIHCVNMADIEVLMKAGKYEEVSTIFSNAAISMKRDGAEALVICANTMHMFADVLHERSGLPVIHLVDATAEVIKKEKIQTIGLLGTRPTMDLDFYREKLSKYGITTLVPNEHDKDFVHQSIFTELSRGIFTEETRKAYIKVMDDLIQRGARGIVLGCTDIPPLLRDYKGSAVLFDTTKIHAEAVADFILEN